MSPEASKIVAILQGNATVAHLMGESLEDSNSFEVEFLQGTPPGAARAQLAIIDVDSGVESAEQWIHHCDGRQLPVLLCGVEPSRSAFSDRPWLSRPFSAQQLLRICHEVLGDWSEVDDESDDDIPPPIEVDTGSREQPTLEMPAQALAEEERALSQEGSEAHQDAATAQRSTEEILDVLDLEGSSSMILEIEDLSKGETVGGMLVSSGQQRPYEPDELFEENPWANQPDTAVDASPEGSGLDASSSSEVKSAPLAKPTLQADVTAVSALGDMSSNDFSGAHRVASLVAEHWDRLGLTARPTDRADRLQRVLTAMLRSGMDGVLDELKRIPPVTGFSGCLETMPVVDLLHTIRDRRLRGRLEIGLDGHSFVLYIDRITLQGIDSLGENTDGLLVEFLRKSGAFDDQTYRHYKKLVAELSGEPLEMKLRRDGIVDDGQLLEAKRERAKHLLAKMCRGEHGTFAFIEVRHESGQVWPTQRLDLNVDSLLLELLRKGTLEEAGAKSVTRSNLVLDAERASRLGPEALTEAEREMLEFFEDGRSVDSARELLGDAGESVDRIVHRLKRLELLRRLGEDSDAEKKSSSTHGAATDVSEVEEVIEDVSSESSEDEQERSTSVSSSWNLQILDEVDPTERTTPDGWPDPLDAGPEEETQEDVGFLAGVPDDLSSPDPVRGPGDSSADRAIDGPIPDDEDG